MDIQKIKELIKAVSDSDLESFQYREGNIEILLGKENRKIVNNQQEIVISANTYPEKNSNADISEEDDYLGNEIKTPLVGTVYLAPKEDAEPFVKVGDKVTKGQVVAIVEAMKLMNEIESEFEGVVKEIMVENGQMVEYGQPLFIV